ncbi:ABC transporter ATP-binding protein [Segetibacter koreensis]|uniref:ABC transporter ATP-binding protein n=1 Tax=Segetibacter koreensis TaxID=398037 RepID=UPI00036F4CF2|nr:ATP-binding cassette domain-containing protein [Segetibacter koreensis]
MIRLKNVSKFYKSTKAVDDISFEVKEGETVVLLGTSGCGKTTTLRMINRLVEPSSGKIVVNGQNILEQPAEKMRRGIGYVLQHHGLFPHYTVAENISIVPNLLKWSKDKIINRTRELLEKLQLSQTLGDLYPSQLSGGQQQRVGLARALAAYPPVLLMDEPLGALDPVTRVGIRKEFTTLDELKRKTILMVTHDVQEAFELGDRVCLMDKGKIVQIGKATDLLFNPINDFVRSFIKEQHFQLELENIFINDIWSLLPKAIDGTNENKISPENSLWQVLETVSARQQGFERFVSINNNDKKQIEIASLMAAYTQYKNSFNHE